jgi:hypothetical protein
VSEIVARYALGKRLGRGPSLLRDALRLAGATPFYELFRPRSLAQVDEAADWVLDVVRRG